MDVHMQEVDRVPRRLLSLDTEALSHIASFLSLESLAAVAATCKELRDVAFEPSFWCNLKHTMWGGPRAASTSTSTASASADARRHIAEFVRLAGGYRGMCRQEMPEDENGLPHDADSRNREPAKWLKLTHTMQLRGLEPHPPRECVIEYRGSSDDAQHGPVGCAALQQRAWPWPGSRVLYYEAHVLDAGEQGYIAIGWGQRSFPGRCRQPGWEQHSYGYHGDDGRAYHRSGFGKPFGPTFGTGSVVGTGLVLPDLSPHDCKPACPRNGKIFYTLNGSLLGFAFREVRCADSLVPAVGVHSPGERVRLRFGGEPSTLFRSAPPTSPRPFLFDLHSLIAKLGAYAPNGHVGPVTDATMGTEVAVDQKLQVDYSPPYKIPSCVDVRGHKRRVKFWRQTCQMMACQGPFRDEPNVLLTCGCASVCLGCYSELRASANPACPNCEEPLYPDEDGIPEALQIMWKLMRAQDDVSEETLDELRTFARCHTGDRLHPSWGADSIRDLDADQLRHLCSIVLHQLLADYQ